MARRKVAYKGAQPRRVKYQAQETLGKDNLQFVVDRPQVAIEVENFAEYLEQQIGIVSARLTASGVTVAKRALLDADTPWGQARVRGSYFGVRFAPYGKGTGRYDTGNMFEALKVLEAESRFGQFRLSFGYDMSMDRSPSTGGERDTVGRPYFEAQERGFLSRRKFSPGRTAASGIASFDSGGRRRVKGANALPAGAESIRKRIDSAFSAAWNEAVRMFERDGFAASGVGTYVDARDAFRANPPRKFSSGSERTQSVVNYELNQRRFKL